MQPTLLAFGAGNIGLSFVGQIFSRSGYRVVFADTDEAIVERLSGAGRYRVDLLDPDGGTERIDVSPVEAIDARDNDALGAVLRDCPLIATSVGLRAFPHVLRSLAAAVAEEGPPEDEGAPVTEGADGLGSGVGPALRDLDIIAAENIHDPRAVAAEILGADAPGVHACSVGKMVPLQSRGESGPVSVRAEAFNTLIVDGTDWRATPPEDVPWIRLVNNVEAWMDRKLFVHNLGHAACAWRARTVDPTLRTIAEAIREPDVEAWTRTVMYAAADLVGQAYPGEFSAEDLAEHAEDLIRRFGNEALGDTVERVGRDLERKLGRNDRFVGAMRLAARLDATRDGSALPGEGRLRAAETAVGGTPTGRAGSPPRRALSSLGGEQSSTGDAALTILTEVARDAVGFGVEGVSEWPGDVQITAQSADAPLSELIGRLGSLSPEDPVDRAVFNSLVD